MSKNSKNNRGCLIAVIVLVAVMLLGIITISSSMKGFRSKPVKVKKGAYVVIDVQGAFPYVDDSMFGRGECTFRKAMVALDYTARDSDVEGIIIRSGNLPLAQAEEMRKAIEKNKENGKKIVAHLNYISKPTYYLASVADEISMVSSESSVVDMRAYYYSNMFLKGFLNMIGVGITVIHMGDYKGTGENYSEDRMSPQLRKNLTDIFRARDDLFVKNVSESRGFDYSEFYRKLNNGDYFLISPAEAEKMKIVDRTEYLSEFYERLDINRKNLVDLNRYAQTVHDFMSREKIALIYAQGTISMGKSRNSFNPLYGAQRILGETTLTSQVRKAAEDNEVKGIVIRVDSPGGSALASDIMWKEISSAAEKKPLYVSFGNVAASGGYYISAPAKKIFSDAYSISGSIGVVFMVPDYKELFTGKLNIRNEEISGGRFAGFGNPMRKIGQDEKKRVMKSMMGTYMEFKSRVAQGRDMTMDEVEAIAQGRVYNGYDAKKAGLVDDIATLEEVLHQMKSELGGGQFMIVEYPRKKSFFESLKENFSSVKIDDFSGMKDLVYKSIALFPYELD